MALAFNMFVLLQTARHLLSTADAQAIEGEWKELAKDGEARRPGSSRTAKQFVKMCES